MIHEVSYTKTEDVVTGWSCTCGQSSGPWPTKDVIDQQMDHHVKEHAAYAALQEKMAKDAARAKERCAYCKRTAKTGVTLPDGSLAHKSCVRKAIADA